MGLVLTVQFQVKKKAHYSFQYELPLRRLGDRFFLAQSLSPDLDSTGKILFVCDEAMQGRLFN